VLKLQH